MNTTYHRATYSNRVEDINLPSWIKALNAAEMTAIEAIEQLEYAPLRIVTHALTSSPVEVNVKGIIAANGKKNVRCAFSFLTEIIEEALQNPAYPCNELPPAQVKPPESLIEGTVLAALFSLYSTCMRLTNPDDLGHQLQPEARQLINDAINKVRHTCEQPTDHSALEKLK